MKRVLVEREAMAAVHICQSAGGVLALRFGCEEGN
jgi:hypothetical protein